MIEIIKLISRDWLNSVAVLAIVGLVVGNIYYVRSKNGYQYTMKLILVDSIMVAIFVVVAWSKGMQHYVDHDTLRNLFDNVISNYVAFVVAYVCIFEKILKNLFEDHSIVTRIWRR